ncbi:MAG TPA: hypothetical protein PLB32_19085, partial [Acidobacteriota bacterium]|nr:hypothetical protein [Acidobacteriota bacterium]
MPQRPFAHHVIICLWLGIWGLICLPGMVTAQRISPRPAVAEKTDNAVLNNAREDWVYQQFTDQNGLPQNSVEAICEWNQYVWVGTQDGIACYNGRQWQRVQFPKNILSTFVYALLPASDKSLWVGLNGGGIAHFKHGEWELFSTQTGHLPGNFIRTLYETQEPDGTSTIWAGTVGNGIVRYHQGQWTQVDMRPWLPTNNIRCFLETQTGTTRRLWVGSLGGGLAYLEEGAWHRFEPVAGKLPDTTVHCLVETSETAGQPRLWIGMESGLACLQNGRLEKVLIPSSSRPNSPVIALRETRSHRGEPRLWVATFSGIHCLFQNQWRQVGNIADNRQQVAISLLATDGINGESSIWVGFNSAGVSRIQKSSWAKFGLDWKPANNTITSLLETIDMDGTPQIWMGTNGSGLVRYRRGEWTLFDTQSGKLSDDVILSLLETIESDGSKTLWVGTLRGGLTRFHNGQWTQVSSAQDGITSSRIFCILETREPDGTQVLWFGTRNGLIRYKNDEWTAVGKEHSTLSTNSIYCLAETGYGDGSKALWVGTNVGLFRLYQNQWTAFDLTNGLPNNQVRDLEVIVAANGTQSLWIATRGGVSTLDLDVPDAEIIPLASTDAPPVGNNVVYRIQQDAQRRIYLSTLRGITRFSPRVPTVENRSPFAAYTYTTEDGLPSNECNAGASMIDRAGRLWFGTIGGATFFDPTQEIPDLMAKPLRLESLLINGSPLFRAQGLTQLASEWNTGHEFAHDENNIVIEYSLLSYFREPDSQYCTQLVGLQDRPTPWTTEAKTVYTTLPQGHYRFKVWGRDYAGNISGPVEIGFTIRPAPWVTWWAFVIYGVVVVGGGYSGYQWRVFRFR